MTSNKNILFQKDYAKDLLRIAEGDLATAKALLSVKDPGRLENILYMIQQAVEKSIKSVLIVKQIRFPLVHDIGILIALLPVDDYPPGGFNLTSLNPYASIRRYETGEIPLDMDEIKGAYQATELVISWAKKNASI